MSDIIKLYNPANAASLTPEQAEGLQNLTSSEIKELAHAYPNITMQRAYLLIIDKTKPAQKQLPTLSTFENLWNLREKNAQRNFVAYGFKGNYQAKNNAPVRNKKQEVLDLSETELMSLPGFKTKGLSDAMKKAEDTIKSVDGIKPQSGKAETVKVTKIKKVPAKKTKSK